MPFYQVNFLNRSQLNSLFVSSRIAEILLFVYTSVIVLSTTAARSYEISVHAGIPSSFFVSIIAIFVLIIFQHMLQPDKVSFISCLVRLVIGIVLLQSVPFMRGYHLFVSGDGMYHIGVVRRMIANGTFGLNNHYPALHILTAELSVITKLNVVDLAQGIPGLFAILTIVLATILGRSIINGTEVRSGLLLLIPVPLLIGNTNFAPFALGEILLLFVFLIHLLAIDSPRWEVLQTIVFFGLVIFHPLLSIFWIIFMLAAALLKRSGTVSNWTAQQYQDVSLSHFTLFTLVFLAWSKYTGLISGPITSFLLNIGLIPSAGGTGGNSPQSQLSIYVEALSTSSPQIFDLIILIVSRYGKIGIPVGISLIAASYYLTRYRKLEEVSLSGHTKIERNIIPLLFLLILFFPLSVAGLIFPLPFGFTRILIFPTITSGVLIVYLVGRNLDTHSLFSIIILVIFITGTISINVSTTYNSVYEGRPNIQITNMETEGMNWVITQRNQGPYFETLVPLTRFISMTNHGSIGTVSTPPEHLRFDHSPPGIFLVTTLNKIVYPSFYPDYEDEWKYAPEDYKRVDTTKSKIYSNSGFEVYLIQ